jgi:flagellin
MITPVNSDLTKLALETHRSRAEFEDSLAKLSSGKRMQNATQDAGGFQQAAKLGSRHKRDVASMQNLQNLISYSQMQDGSLESVGKILQRMNTLATRALDVTTTDADRENYNKEFLELATELEQIKVAKFNDMDVFGAGGFSDAKQDFIDSLKNGWLKKSEEKITSEYGWNVKPGDSWDLIVNENDTGGYAAFVMTSWNATGAANVIEMQFDLPDFAAPHTQPTSTADRVVAHEMVHVMQAQNSFYGDITGDGSSRGTWFKEGLAELIHGADNRILGILGAAPSSAQIDSLLTAIGTGNESWTTNEQYGTAYLAARYLHTQLQAAGLSGVKHLTQWMENQFNNVAGATAANSGLDAYLQNFTTYADTNAFLADYKGVNGRNFVQNQFINNSNLTNTDTGSIAGSDAGGGGILTAQDVIPDTTGTTGSSPVFEVEKGSLAATVDGSGSTWNLQSVNTVVVSDTATYNLENITNARGTLTQLTDWMENLATERSTVGANLSRLEKEMDNLSRKMGSREMAFSRIDDTDVARESTKFASNQVRMQASVAILAQGKQTTVSLADLVRGVNVGG